MYVQFQVQFFVKQKSIEIKLCASSVKWSGLAYNQSTLLPAQFLGRVYDKKVNHRPAVSHILVRGLFCIAKP